MADAIIENPAKELVVDPLSKKDVEKIVDKKLSDLPAGDSGIKLYKHLLEAPNSARLYIVSTNSQPYTSAYDIIADNNEKCKILSIKLQNYTGQWGGSWLIPQEMAAPAGPTTLIVHYSQDGTYNSTGKSFTISSDADTVEEL